MSTLVSAANHWFVDSNVLVYALVTDAAQHPIARNFIEHHRKNGQALAVNPHVLRRFVAILTKAMPPGAQNVRSAVLNAARSLANSFTILDDNERVQDYWLTLVEKYPIVDEQVQEANIVATMHAYGIKRLVTFKPEKFALFLPAIEIVVPQ